MRNATARPVVPNLEPMVFAPEKGARDEKFSCEKRPLTTRSKRPRQSDVSPSK